MTNTYNFETIFRQRMFRIPDYQRGYAWETRHLNDLLEDLELLPPGRTHYTGTLVVRPVTETKLRDENGHTYEIFDVIDGQQRLTTIVIFLDALHDEFERLGKKELADGLRKTYLSILDRNGRPQTKLTLNQDSQDYFYNDVLGFSKTVEGPLTRSHKNLLEAHQRVEEYLASNREKYGEGYGDWLFELFVKITEGLTVLLYEVENEMDAGVIFETMNDRGKELTDLEKIKNHFLYIASKLELEDAHDLNTRINQTWKTIFEELMVSGLSDDENESQLLRTHWLMTFDPIPHNWKRYKTVKEHFSLKQYQNKHKLLLKDLIVYLEGLKNTVSVYCDIHTPTRAGAFGDVMDKDIRSQILTYSEKLVRLGSRATFIPLLCAVRLNSTDNGITYLKVLKLCELFDFRVYQLMRARSQTGQSTFFILANKFSKNPSPAQLISSITRTTLEYCSNASFLERFNRETEDWYHWYGLKYFLYEYELFLAEKAHEPVHMHWEDLWDTKRDTLEHILPQTPTNAWKEAFPDEDLRKRWTHDIGNLTLTYDNSSLQNKAFIEKRGQPSQPSCYSSSSFFTERQLTSCSQWTENEIIERRERIKNWALTRWEIDESVMLPEEKIDDFLEHVRKLAEDGAVDIEYDAICKFSNDHQLFYRPRKLSLMFAPEANHTIALFTIWPKNGYLRVGVWFSNIETYLNISRQTLQQIFETNEDQIYVVVTSANIEDFIAKLNQIWL